MCWLSVQPVQGFGKALDIQSINARLERTLQAVFQISVGFVTALSQHLIIHNVSTRIGVTDKANCFIPKGLLYGIFHTEARLTARGGNAFRDYSLPEAVLKFRQGIGRLIRSKTDTGLVTILDSRVTNKFYGARFMYALPATAPREFL